MNVVVDAGNTRIKYALFNREKLLESKYGQENLLEDLTNWKSNGCPIDVFLSGSGKIPGDLVDTLKGQASLFAEASPLMEMPLKIGYKTPETLGFDRIAVCTGAVKLFPGSPLLVIDSGTCITYNYVNTEGVFWGGNISPGMEMRFTGLHRFTARLPLVGPEKEYGGIGATTVGAIRNGVMQGMLFEVESYVQRFLEEQDSGRIVITGGNACYLEHHLQEEKVVFDENLGFIGLNEIFSYIKKLN